jgi:hypothetical protein
MVEAQASVGLDALAEAAPALLRALCPLAMPSELLALEHLYDTRSVT